MSGTISHKRLLIFSLIGVLLLTGVLVFFLTRNNYGLTNEEILTKFECRRITADIRETDIFCVKPELYRTGYMSEADYTAWRYADCDERLKNPLSDEQRKRDEAVAAAYDNCLEKPGLHKQYVEFTLELKRLREKY